MRDGTRWDGDGRGNGWGPAHTTNSSSTTQHALRGPCLHRVYRYNIQRIARQNACRARLWSVPSKGKGHMAAQEAFWPVPPPPDGQEGSSLDPATTPFRNGIHPVSMPTCLPGSLATRLAREGILKGGARVRVRESRALVVFFDFFFSPSHNSFSLVLSLSCGAQSYFYLPDNPWLCAPVVLVRRIASSPCLAVGYMYLPMYSIRRTDRLYTRDGVFGTEVS